MHSIDDIAGIHAAFDRLDATLDRCAELSFDGLTAPELWALLDRFEAQRARLATVCYELTSPFVRAKSKAPIVGGSA
jgi:hypothetical protein